ncbi:MAG: type II secretion system protein, partial [Pseudomonadota bacterium]
MFRLCKIKNKTGMTLIEVIIALALFSIISLFTISNTSVGMRIRNKVASTNDYYHAARIALKTMNRDIALSFHAYSDSKLGEYYKSQAVLAGTLTPEQYNAIPFSFFKGTKDKLSFSSTVHRRMYKNSNETDTCEISYYLETDQDNDSVYNLMKRESFFIDDKFEEGGPVSIVASGIESMSFRYFTP